MSDYPSRGQDSGTGKHRTKSHIYRDLVGAVNGTPPSPKASSRSVAPKVSYPAVPPPPAAILQGNVSSFQHAALAGTPGLMPDMANMKANARDGAYLGSVRGDELCPRGRVGRLPKAWPKGRATGTV